MKILLVGNYSLDKQESMLRFADVAEDAHLLAWARRLAPVLLDQHPHLAQTHVQRWLGNKAEYLNA